MKKPETKSADNAEKDAVKQEQIADQVTEQTAEEGRLPETMAIANPDPATSVDSASGAIVEDEIKAAILLDHPSVDSNPRAGTSAIQNGGDFNDARWRHPSDPHFTGQGLDMSVYGKDDAAKTGDA
ncbi:hypothetical protein ASD00_36040 [Ensifer sp. Root31]|uniref:hypothetical protein n=1 Tax=Ensifer sp. Root31 TaxID=1736512 RepID=UPI00070C2302|nr:hypothetical protein [Ensifer sp. Root31]KQU79823.1 hypothetical protein ASD00_36040 [Ensifer sp. Root31]